MARHSPQEKKQLSYEHDHRNVYGENDKSSRKAIPHRAPGEGLPVSEAAAALRRCVGLKGREP